MGQIWFQNQSIEFEVARLDRFCCPIALTIAVQNLTHACTTFCRILRPPPDKPQKVRKTCFICRDFKNEKWDRFGFKTDQLNLKLCA